MFAFYRSRDVSAAGASSAVAETTVNIHGVTLSRIMTAAVLEVFGCSIVTSETHVCLCVELCASRSARSASFVQSLFILSMPPTWRRVVSITSLMSLHLMYILQRVDQSGPKMSAFPFTV